MTGLRDASPEAFDRGVAHAEEQRASALVSARARLADLEARQAAGATLSRSDLVDLGLVRWAVDRYEALER